MTPADPLIPGPRHAALCQDATTLVLGASFLAALLAGAAGRSQVLWGGLAFLAAFPAAVVWVAWRDGATPNGN